MDQAPISVDDFRAELSNACSALGLYEVLKKGDIAKLRTQVGAAREKEAHVVLSEVDKGLAAAAMGFSILGGPTPSSSRRRLSRKVS